MEQEMTRAQKNRANRREFGRFEYTTTSGEEYTLKKPSTIRLTQIMEGLGILELDEKEVKDMVESEGNEEDGRKMKLGLQVYSKVMEVAEKHLPILSIDPKILPLNEEVTGEDEISLDELDEDDVLELMIALTKNAGGKEGQEKAKKFLANTTGQGGGASGEDIWDTPSGDTGDLDTG